MAGYIFKRRAIAERGRQHSRHFMLVGSLIGIAVLCVVGFRLLESQLQDTYTVMVTSQISEVEAQAAYIRLQDKYPEQLGGRAAIIRRALTGDGIYYLATVGWFATAGDAAKLCSTLKAAGASCTVQRN
jgi:hypothetical protein